MKLSKSHTETLAMFHEAFGEHSLRQTVVFEWHSCFKAGRVTFEKDKTFRLTKHQQNNIKC
jgi:hypothetical protein